LTTAITLLRNGAKHVTVVGKDIPGDTSSQYASPKAGASIISFASVKDKRLQGTTCNDKVELVYPHPYPSCRYRSNHFTGIPSLGYS
jgi:hypothetical protein